MKFIILNHGTKEIEIYHNVEEMVHRVVELTHDHLKPTHLAVDEGGISLIMNFE